MGFDSTVDETWSFSFPQMHLCLCWQCLHCLTLSTGLSFSNARVSQIESYKHGTTTIKFGSRSWEIISACRFNREETFVFCAHSFVYNGSRKMSLVVQDNSQGLQSTAKLHFQTSLTVQKWILLKLFRLSCWWIKPIFTPWWCTLLGCWAVELWQLDSI